MGKSGRAKGIWHLVRIGPFYVDVDAAGLDVASRELEICNGMMNLRLDFGDYHNRSSWISSTFLNSLGEAGYP